MKPNGVRYACFLLLIFGLLCTSPCAFAADKPSLFGLQTFGTGGGVGFNQMSSQYAEYGAQTIRTFLSWGQIYDCFQSKKKDAYDFSVPDWYVDLYHKQGIKDIILVIDFNTIPACHCVTKPDENKDCLPKEEAFAAFVRETALHYKGKVRFWEIGNEVNLTPHWTPTTYAKYLTLAYDAIKQTQPEAVVSTSGLAQQLDIKTGIELEEARDYIPAYLYAARVMEALNRSGRLPERAVFDAVALHPYRTWQNPTEKVNVILANGQRADVTLAEQLQGYAMVFYDRDPKKRFPDVWVTEIGWMAIDDKRHDDVYLGMVTLDEQIRYLEATYRMVMDSSEMQAMVGPICWSVVVDDVKDSASLTRQVERSGDPNDHFLFMGLYYYDGRPKPSGRAYKRLSEEWK